MNIRIVFALLFIVGLSFTASAQTISIGPRVGVNFANQIVSGDDSRYADNWNDEVKSIVGLQVGAVANIKFSEMFSVQPELMFVQKGYEFTFDDRKATGKYDYLELPVLAKISIGNGPLQGFVTAGPTLGYWASGKDTYKTDRFEISEDVDFDDDELLEKRFEFGGSIGLGLAYNTGLGTFNFDARYHTGFTSAYESDNNEKLRNSGISLSVAYLFGL
ncbi:porin family protein [Pontibacter burrus]|uniref:PorT family protein n=1 Tax=Pontibacter burrus TaxID=2704466 RepID=A0A6B3M006_9BACT|nr:porin family protein [Pontibacter burrus]NEM99230.1 PorT family protein [Pontibacter burrus]